MDKDGVIDEDFFLSATFTKAHEVVGLDKPLASVTFWGETPFGTSVFGNLDDVDADSARAWSKALDQLADELDAM